MKDSILKYICFVISFIFWLFLSLFSSQLIVDSLTSSHKYSNWLFNLHYIQNSGAAFSLLQNAHEFLIIVSIAAVTLLFVYVHNHIRSLHYIALIFLGTLAAGIMSNCHERIVLGYVRDYIQLKHITFPIFNIADIYITFGVIALIVILLFYKGK